MLSLNNTSLIAQVVCEAKKISSIGKLYIATSDQFQDDIIESYVRKNIIGVDLYRGDLENVLSRFYDIVMITNADFIVRFTADNPLLDIGSAEILLGECINKNIAYGTFSSAYGSAIECFSRENIIIEWENNLLEKDLLRQEHVTYYMRKMESSFHFRNEQYENLRTTIDTFEDYVRMSKFFIFCEEKNIEPSLDIYKEFSNECFY